MTRCGSGVSAWGQPVHVGDLGDEAREERLRWLRHVQRRDSEFEWKDADGGTGRQEVWKKSREENNN